MKRTFFMAALLCGGFLSPVRAETIGINIGTIEVPSGFHQERTGTKDSEMGVITSPREMLTIYYDIGHMAGTRMYPGLQQDCLWYREQIINGRQVISGIMNKSGKKQLVITIKEEIPRKGAFLAPANFWADINKDEDIAETLLIALSFAPRPGK